MTASDLSTEDALQKVYCVCLWALRTCKALLLARGEGHGVTVTFRFVVIGRKQTECSCAVPLTFGHQYSVFWELTASVIARNSSSYERMSDSERLPRYSCSRWRALFFPPSFLMLYIFVCGVEEWSSQKRGGHVGGTAWQQMDAAARKKRDDQPRRTKRDLRTVTRSASGWDLRTFVMDCNNSHFCVTNLSLEH